MKISRWELILVWSLRVVLLGTGIAMLVLERWPFALFALVALAVGMIPTLGCRDDRADDALGVRTRAPDRANLGLEVDRIAENLGSASGASPAHDRFAIQIAWY